MSDISRSEDAEQARIMLGLLESVERNGAQTQRGLASELGIALGLVNAYLKRCINKGLVKVRQAPAHRYAYYLTPQGFAEKSRLTVDYLSYSFSFFRQARADCAQILVSAEQRGVRRVALIGISDLTDIVRLCALEKGIEVVAVVDAKSADERYSGVPIVVSLDTLAAGIDAVIVTDLYGGKEAFAAAAEKFGADKVYAPSLLALRPVSA